REARPRATRRGRACRDCGPACRFRRDHWRSLEHPIRSRARGLSRRSHGARVSATRESRSRAGDRRPTRDGAPEGSLAPAAERYCFRGSSGGGVAMTVPHARGACPRLAKPMQTGDGLLARLVTAGPMPLDAFIGLCAAAQEHGNGMMEISSRGSLQVRGLTPVSAPLFASAVAGLDIELCERAPVLSGPLPDDPAALIDADALASSLRRAIAAHELQLAPKVSVVIDGGGCLHLDALTADLRLRAIESAEGTRLHVSIAGDAASATPLDLVALDDAIDIAMRILALIATSGPAARAADLLQSDGIGNFGKAVGNRMARAAPLPRRQRAEPIGLHRLSGKGCAIGVALAFGQASAGDLMAFAGVA